MTAAPVRLVWRRRDPPLSPSAVVAQGDAVAGLIAATAGRLRSGAELRVSANNDWLLVLGESADLPWADNVTYLGWEGGLLLPTIRTCHPPADLVRAALLPHLASVGSAGVGNTGVGSTDVGSTDVGKLIVLLGRDVLVTTFPARSADLAQLVVRP